MKFLKLLRDIRTLRPLLSLRYSGYIFEAGWFESVKTQASVDRSGKPIPWISYPCIRFLDERLPPQSCMFEFGSGNSTLYFAGRVRSLTSVEHDLKWVMSLQSKLPEHAALLHIPLDENGEYARSAVKTKKRYDVIFIDGRDRVNCIRYSMKCLKKKGVIILDDSERDEYNEGSGFLKKRGFKRLDFTGMAPTYRDTKCTSIFYRNANVFNL